MTPCSLINYPIVKIFKVNKPPVYNQPTPAATSKFPKGQLPNNV